jgi:hypothetical protein
MRDHWLFFLDADGWLGGPESTPSPHEANTIKAARGALGTDASFALWRNRARAWRSLRKEKTPCRRAWSWFTMKRRSGSQCIARSEKRDMMWPLSPILSSRSTLWVPLNVWNCSSRVCNSPPGDQTGQALALMARSKWPDVRILFVCQPEFMEHVRDIGECLPATTAVPEVIKVASQMIAENP